MRGIAPCCFRADSTAPCSSPTRPRERRRGAAGLRQRGARVGARRAAASSTGCLAAGALGASRAAAGLAVGRHARRLSGHALGAAGPAAGLPHAGRGRVPAGPQHRAARQGRRVLRGGRASTGSCIGTLDHNPFPDATPAFRDAMAAALSLGLSHPLTIAAPFGDDAQGGRHPARRGARRAARADAVVHEPDRRRRALRRLQQVPRAARRVRRGGRRRSDDLRLASQRRFRSRTMIEPSPVRTRT